MCIDSKDEINLCTTHFFSKILTEVVKRVWMITFLFGNCVLNCDEKRKRRKCPIYAQKLLFQPYGKNIMGKRDKDHPT